MTPPLLVELLEHRVPGVGTYSHNSLSLSLKRSRSLSILRLLLSSSVNCSNGTSITAAPRRCSALGLGYDSKFSLPCGVLMAGNAAGFSGLEPEFSLRSCLSLSAISPAASPPPPPPPPPLSPLNQTESGVSCSRFRGGYVQPRRDPFNIVEAPRDVCTYDQHSRAGECMSSLRIRAADTTSEMV